MGVSVTITAPNGVEYQSLDSFIIAGRGKVYVVEAIPSDFGMPHNPFPVDLIIQVNGADHHLRGIETFTVSKRPELYERPQSLGLLVRPV